MIFTTQLELNITINDINAIYSIEYGQMLLDHAKLMYERKCINGQYVKSIDRLVKRSLANIIKRDLSSKVRVFVVVEATVIRYDQYDFITNTRVNKVIAAGKISMFDMLECRNDHVVALMTVQTGIEQFQVGDIVPIRVGQSMYKIGNEHILVNGLPCVAYVPDQELYSIGKMTPEAEKFFKTMMLPLFERELARKQTLNHARWKQFMTLLHPYKTIPPTLSSDYNVLDVTKLENGLFGVNYKDSLAELKAMKAEPNVTDGATVVSEPPDIALTRISLHFIKWLETINNLTKQYESDKAFHHLDHVWDAYKASKRTLPKSITMEDIKTIKKKITTSIKELDRANYVDICILIKSKTTDTTKIVSETPRGTFIDLDCIDEQLLRLLHYVISTKLQRIMRS